jgi:2-haloacid dehalogenase
VPEIKIRPDFITFDCYGTLIDFEIQSVTRRLLGDQLTREQFAAFVPAFGDAVRSWGPHADVPAPLKTLAGEFPLVILSNADDAFLVDELNTLLGL